MNEQPIAAEDWEALNAYADGELDARAQARIRERLAGEPGLADALERIETAKREVRAWSADVPSAQAATRSEVREHPAAHSGASVGRSVAVSGSRRSGRRRSVWRTRSSMSVGIGGALAGAIAASLVFLLAPGVVPGSLRPAATADAPLVARGNGAFDVPAWHRQLSLDGASGAESFGAQLVSSVPLDLALDGFALRREVVLPLDQDRWVHLRHYAGPNGCRLTHAVSTVPHQDAAAGDLTHGWRVGDRHHMLLARDMDPRRFAALANYAERATRLGTDDDRTRLASAALRSQEWQSCSA